MPNSSFNPLHFVSLGLAACGVQPVNTNVRHTND